MHDKSMIIEKFKYSTLSRESVNGKRHYLTPNGDRIPSVTTILDATKPAEAKAALMNWKKSIGEKKAQEITTEAANRGTRMHKYLEDYIKGIEINENPTNPYARQSVLMAKKIIDQGFPPIDEVWGNEVPLYFPGLYAGTTDCVGIHDGKESILDFKQTNKPKKENWIEDYYLQLAAYALAHNELFGTSIRKGVIMMCVRPDEINPGVWGEPQYQQFVIDEEKFDYWSHRWWDRVEQYYKIN